MHAADGNDGDVGLLRLLIAFALSAAGLIAVLSLTTLEEIWATFRAIPPSVVLAFLAIYVLVNLGRAARFRLLVGGAKVSSLALFPATLAHNGLTQVIPFRLGELSWPLLLRQCFQRPVAHGLSSLFAARLLDVLAVLTFGSLAVIALHLRQSVDSTVSLLAVAALFGASFVLLIKGRTLMEWVQRAVTYSLRLLPGRLRQFGERLLRIAHEAAAHLDHIARSGGIGRAALVTVLVYGGTVACQWSVLMGVGVEAEILTMVVMISIVLMTSWIPLSISGFGIVEGSWTLVLIYFASIDAPRAAAIGIALHVIQLLAATLTGLIGLGLVYARQRVRREGRH